MSLESLQAAITNFELFWSEHANDYRNQAAKIAETVALKFRGNQDPSAWQEKCAKIANGITATVNQHTLTISIPSIAVTERMVITRQILRRWVEAGERGQEGAKRITADDREILAKGEEGMKQLLARLGNAYYGGKMDDNYVRLRQAINQWAGETNGGTTSPVKSIPPQILNAIKHQWDEWFSAIIPPDLKQWMTKQAKQHLI